jgi:hypothetical protein
MGRRVQAVLPSPIRFDVLKVWAGDFWGQLK